MEIQYSNSPEQLRYSEDFLRSYFAEVDDTSPTEPSQDQLLRANIELFGHASAIPVANRLRYLIGDEELNRSSRRYIELDELATKLEIDEETLHELVSELNIPEDMRPVDEFGNVSLAPGLDVVIAEELRWRKQYDELPDMASILTMANALDIGHTLAGSILKSTQIAAQLIRHKGVTPYGHYYPKPLIHRVRAELMIFPPARKHKTLERIVGEIGCGRTWAEGRVDENVIPELMRMASGPIKDHYDPEFEKQLSEEHAERPEAEEGMFTAQDIADKIDRDIDWVQARLPRYHNHKITRFKKGKECTFYNKAAFQGLYNESEQQRGIPKLAENESGLPAIVRLLDTTYETAEYVLQQMGMEPLKRLDPYSGKNMKAYNLSVLVPLGLAIVQYTEQRIADYQNIIAELSSVPKDTLSIEDRKRLNSAKRLATNTGKLLRRSQAAYEKITSDSTSVIQPEISVAVTA